MSDRSFGGVELSRAPGAANPGPLDEALYDLVEARFRRVVEEEPTWATYLGIHAWDDRLPDPSRERILGDAVQDRAHVVALEALDPAGLSPEARFERDLELHQVRLRIFRAETLRIWERRSTGTSSIGDSLFPLFTRDFAPLRERLATIAARLEQAPAFLRGHRSRAVVPQVGPWLEIELRASMSTPRFLDDIIAAADAPGTDLPSAERRRLGAAIERAKVAIEDQSEWIREILPGATPDWPVGRELYGQMIELRAFENLDADRILEIGWEQLERNHADRVAAAREIDPDATEAEVVERVKDDHPDTFDEAIEEYRVAMRRARSHIIERGLATVPEDERVDVIETPPYLRGVIPFAAYYQPAQWDPDPVGVYIVTPDVDGDPGAMREHYRAAISNTSIHEAYPGHHLQLALAARHPSLTRVQVDAPEFVEGWGMYSEQLLREHGFDDGPAFRVALATDAIWRAARIVLDVRMHRGEVSIEEAADFLVEHTGFERPNALAEARRYTYTPTYNLSYLLGKVLLLELRGAEQQRLGSAFSLRAFHDMLLRGGSLPISFHRRALHGEGARPPGLASPTGAPG
ncbi:MAG TPA: DUF885 domain-containing protein [Candidatus Limnocylindrales bacterium]|nr:DUF885 domain-containing protein [Candidatus Limnocylindrales bacterium]